MKSSKKTVVLVVAVLLLIVSVLAGCGSGKEVKDGEKSDPTSNLTDQGKEAEQPKDNLYDNGLSKDDKVSLKIAAADQGYGKEMYEFAVAKFMEMYPNVKIELTASPKINDIVSAKVAANDDNDMFDLVLGKYGFNTSMIKGGLVEDLTDVLDLPTWDNKDVKFGADLMESAKNLYMYDGKLRLIPLDLSLIGIVYNKKMFVENGWNENPKTWDEFLKLCETIKNSGKTVPFAFGGTVGYLPWMTNMAAIYHDGWLDRYVKREKGIYSDPANLSPLVKLKQLKDKGYFLKGTEALDHTQSQMEFLQGKAAMIPTGSWIENEMKNSAPADFQYGFMLQPINDKPVTTRYIQGFAIGLWMYEKKPDLSKKWTKEFIRYYYSKAVQGKFIQNGGIPVMKSMQIDESMLQLASPFNREVMTLLSSNVELNLAFSMLPPDKLTANPKYPDAENKVMSNGYLEVYMGIKTPEQVGAEADAEIEKAWAEVGGR
ncbi:extracellular solute-binding protein [Paenibacillus eucommiae]|uniref:N-acetylglucosamine transport system substrate-binding protein n=1 Tax=Paenibacillus eucommiae TaxID=1355755 RepID=A0ABS4IME4_9BACL|nr:extracellular solute-binding protein [Paenibacillus eucommiae]MBP1988678.1 N-acetylglucosamine transport system substrate-binding protein [Paenibacillus eucommiae]